MYQYSNSSWGNGNHAKLHYPEIERLIGNAVCDPGFAEVLLRDPHQALASGGYHLRMSQRESQLVLSIQGAGTIREFATRLYQCLQEKPVAAVSIGAFDH